jgi:PAS domain S-box-containing protein
MKVKPTGVERKLRDDEIIVSKTDPTGRIMYVNDTFLTISDYTEEDVVGQPHSIVRHPDMPRCVFKTLWESIQSGQEIFAYVCNLTKFGDHYWVFAHVTPTFDESGTILGFHSNRRAPEPRSLATIQDLYRQLLNEERRHTDRRKSLQAGAELMNNVVMSKAAAYDEFIFAV